MPAALFPVLEQGRQAGLICFFVPKQGFKEESVLEKFFEWFAGAGFLALGPGLVGGGDVAEARGEGVWGVCPGESGAQGFQFVDAGLQVWTGFSVVFQGGQEVVVPLGQGFRKPAEPQIGVGGFVALALLAHPLFRRRQ